jgi:CheY-like chemotaxis protein
LHKHYLLTIGISIGFPKKMSFPNKPAVLVVGEGLKELEFQKAVFSSAGLDVFIAEDVKEGFRLARRHMPDAIVSEFELPGLPGSELCRMIREDRHLRNTAFIFVGEAYMRNANVSDAFNAGADDYIPAHFDPQYLLAKIQWFLEKRSAKQNLSNYYEHVRNRHLRITSVVKETSVLIRELDDERRNDAPGEAPGQYKVGIDERLDLGLGMINAIADLVEEQTKALDNVWDRQPAIEHVQAA